MTSICSLTTGHEPFDERIYFKQALSLSKSFFVTILCASKFNSIPPPIKNHKIKIQYFKSRNKRDVLSLRRLFYINQRLRVIQPSLLICHEPDALLYAVLSRATSSLGYKIIYDSHEMWAGVFAYKFRNKKLGELASRVFQSIEGALVRHCDYAYGASDHICDFLSKYLPKSRIRTIYNATSEDVFNPPTLNSVQRAQISVKIICHDGSLNKEKGLEIIFLALAELCKLTKNFKFILIGDIRGIDEKKWIEKFFSDNDCVAKRTIITGWLQYMDVGAYLDKCHIGISCSSFKPNSIIAAPNKIFNYMYYGIPFVMPEHMLISRNLCYSDQCAIASEYDSPSKYAKALFRFLKDNKLYEYCSSNAKIKSNNLYLWSHQELKLKDSVDCLLNIPAT